MKAFIHFKDGTQVIDGREYSGYEPCRSDRVLSIHIPVSNYDIHIFPTGITIKHKYLALTQKTFRIGRWSYSIDALETFKGQEKNRLMAMNDLLLELLHSHSICGEAIQDHRILSVLATHRELL